MKNNLRNWFILFLVLITALLAVSCSKTPQNTISQADYDNLKAQLTAAQTEISNLQAKLQTPTTSLNDQALKDEITSLQGQIDKLGKQIMDLNAQNDALAKEKASLQTKYDDLNAKYLDLQKTLATNTPPPTVELTEQNVENEIFRLINVERAKAGVPELIFGKNLYSLAKGNDRNMERLGRFDYDASVAYQEVFWGINYESVEAISTAALRTWMLNQYRFNTGALLNTNTYGAVGAYYSNGVFFITFIAAGYP